MNTEKFNKFKTLVTKEVSPIHEKMAWRRANQEWLDKSKAIAIKVLATLKEKKMNQIQLAALMNVTPQQVNKIVKGQENLSLETIAKIEKALDIQIIAIPEYKFSQSLMLNNNTVLQKQYQMQNFELTNNLLVHPTNITLGSIAILAIKSNYQAKKTEAMLFQPITNEITEALAKLSSNTQYAMSA
jgi:transcriptional regulator with XRE-family HTH domain